MAMKRIEEAVASGTRQHKACEVVGISERTVRRWSQESNDLVDKRAQAARQSQHPQALTEQEKQVMVQVCNSTEFTSLPPSQIVPRLAYKSSFYRLLKACGQQHRTATQEGGCPASLGGHISQPSLELGHHVPAQHGAGTVPAPAHGA